MKLTSDDTMTVSGHALAGEVAAYIRANCSGRGEAVTIAGISRRFALSETALKLAFRRRYRRSIHAFLVEARMEQACRLLRQGPHPVKEVAALAGYTECSNFSRDFARYKGLSPHAYRAGRREK